MSKERPNIPTRTPEHPALHPALPGFLPCCTLEPLHWHGYPGLSVGLGAAGEPRTDVIDQEEVVLVRALVAGYRKDDLDVVVGDRTLTLRAAPQPEDAAARGHYYRHEIARGGFSRSLELPALVDGHKAKAKVRDGILEVTIPKQDAARGHRVEVD
jgi:HSP20 family protein